MKEVTVTLPIEEAIDVIRLLRAESRCLLENGDVMPDFDVVKRAQNVLSARERIVTSLEEIGILEEEPKPLPQGMLDLTEPGREQNPMIDRALEAATCGDEDGILDHSNGAPTLGQLDEYKVTSDPMRRW